MSQTIYVLTQLPDIARLTAEALPECRVIEVSLTQYSGKFELGLRIGDQELNEMKDAEIVFGDPNLLVQTFSKLAKVKWMQGMWAGIDWYYKVMAVTGQTPPQCAVTRFSGEGYGQTMFEYCVGHIIATERKFFNDFLNSRTQKTWIREATWHYKSLNEMTVAILGATGAIGTYMANRFAELGSRVIGFGRTERDPQSLSLDKYSTKLEDILPECDCLINVLPSTPQSIGLLNNDTLSMCGQKKPIFINIGRGSVIAESEIIKALENKWISSAILDVFETEPLPDSSPLWSTHNVVITPHISAITRPKDCVKVFVENYKRYVNKEKLLYLVDWHSGY